MWICLRCIKINRKLGKCYLDKGFRINVCSGEIVMLSNKLQKRIEDAQFSACKTCTRKLCDCGRSYYEKIQIIEELIEYVEEDFSVLHKSVKVSTFNKVSDDFIYLCVFFMQTVDRFCDKVVDSFKKAFKDGRL